MREAVRRLPPDERLNLETHLGNLAQLAAHWDQGQFDNFPESNGHLVSEPSRLVRVYFTVEPVSRVIYVHRVEMLPATSN